MVKFCKVLQLKLPSDKLYMISGQLQAGKNLKLKLEVSVAFLKIL